MTWRSISSGLYSKGLVNLRELNVARNKLVSLPNTLAGGGAAQNDSSTSIESTIRVRASVRASTLKVPCKSCSDLGWSARSQRPYRAGAMRALVRLDCRENQIRALPHSVGGGACHSVPSHRNCYPLRPWHQTNRQVCLDGAGN